MDINKCFLTACYFGLLPKAPGTWGTAAGIGSGYIILLGFSKTTLFLFSILVFIIAVKEIQKYEKRTNTHDDKKIVIDEVVGSWIGMLFLHTINIWTMGVFFLFFRYFDITKPSVIGKADKNIKNAAGVMIDDVLAGIFAGICTAILFVGVKDLLKI
jgi:phosphatidylglycerophosphatase A